MTSDPAPPTSRPVPVPGPAGGIAARPAATAAGSTVRSSGGRTVLSSILWCAALVVLGTAALLRRVQRHAVDVPMSDQWELIPTLTKWRSGHLGLADLAAPHNEHRLLVPRALMVVLAELTGWNTRAEMVVSVVLMGALASAAVALAWRDLGHRTAVASAPLVVALALTAAQAQNVLWGWQLQMPLAVLGSVVAVGLVGRRGRGAFAWGLVAALVSQWSFGTGVTVWPLAAVLVAVHPDLPVTTRRRRLATVVAVAVISTGVYLRGLGGGSLGGVVRHPWRTLRFTLAQLGLPLASRPFDCSPSTQAICGRTATETTTIGAAIAIFGVALAVLAWRRLGRRSHPLIAVGLGAVASCALVAAGRSGAGIDAAFESRYVTLALPLWWSSAVVACALVLDAPLRRAARAVATPPPVTSGVNIDAEERGGASRGVNGLPERQDSTPGGDRRPAMAHVAVATICLLLGAGVVARSQSWDAWYRGRAAGTLAFRAAVLSASPTDEQLSGGYLADVVRSRIPEARALGWSAWRGRSG